MLNLALMIRSTVTNDKKLRKRLNAIYDYLGIKTRCISYKEFEEALS